MDANETQRQARNAVRKGSILDVDHAAALCRVAIGESDDDGLQTNWIPWLTPAAGSTREWLPPTKGEQVLLLCPMGDPAQGVALRGLFSDALPAPDNSPNTHTRVYPDGARVQYEHTAHTLTVALPASATVRIIAPASVTVETKQAIVKAEEITFDAPQTTCEGALLIKGALTFESGMTGKGGDGSDNGVVMKIEGCAEFTDDVRARGVSLVGHPHTAQGEFSRTTKPIPGVA